MNVTIQRDCFYLIWSVSPSCLTSEVNIELKRSQKIIVVDNSGPRRVTMVLHVVDPLTVQ